MNVKHACESCKGTKRVAIYDFVNSEAPVSIALCDLCAGHLALTGDGGSHVAVVDGLMLRRRNWRETAAEIEE